MGLSEMGCLLYTMEFVVKVGRTSSHCSPPGQQESKHSLIYNGQHGGGEVAPASPCHSGKVGGHECNTCQLVIIQREIVVFKILR